MMSASCCQNVIQSHRKCSFWLKIFFMYGSNEIACILPILTNQVLIGLTIILLCAMCNFC